MSTGIIVAVIVVIVVVAAVAAVAAQTRRRRLRERFGPEYDRVVEENTSRRKAESELVRSTLISGQASRNDS
jgi:protein-S-isoprenylcysteine O-methyltransferase Ste14